MVSKIETKGSITVFMSLTIIMVLSLVFALIEVVHFTGLGEVTKTVSKLGTESAFGDFNRPLLEDYGVLGLDGGYCGPELDMGRIEARITSYLMENINPGLDSIKVSNFYRAIPSVEILDYGLLTDSGGAAFIKQGAEVAALNIPDELFNDIRNGADGLSGADLSEGKVEAMLNDSNAKLKESEKSEELEELKSPLSSGDQALLEQNGSPIEQAIKWKNMAVLGQVVDTSGLSEKVLSSADRPSVRVGSNWETAGTVSVTATEKMLFGQYLKQKFGFYGHETDKGGLSYQWEYVINGKDSDIKNLEATVVKLLGLREAQNLAAIMSDPVKQETALGIAAAICAAIAMPALVEAVKLGVIAAWAYLESVLDVRLLLAGGRVAPVKDASQWTSNILMFPSYLPVSVTAKNCDTGLNYGDYLMVMTMILSARNLGMRSLDVVEAAIREVEDYGEVRMENFLYRAKFLYEYEATPVFASVTPMLAGKLDDYHFTVAEELSYID